MKSRHTLASVSGRPLAFIPVLLAIPLASLAQTTTLRVAGEVAATKRIHVEEGGSRLLAMSEPVVRVSVANPDIADLKVINPTQLLLTAKSVGSTDLTLWNREDEPVIYTLHITKNLDELRRQLKELFPNEAITAEAAGNLIVLSGEVSDLRVPGRARELAKLHADKVANLLQIKGNQQVQLEVRFAEVSRSGLRDMGLNLFARDETATTLGGLAPPAGLGNVGVPGTAVGPQPAPGVPPGIGAPAFGNAFNLFYSTTRGGIEFSSILSMLESSGLAKMLAEPSLVALTGQEASFLAGGEIPIPIPQGLGQVSIQFKKFGVQLKFTPTVLAEDLVQLGVYTEVSDVDPGLGISLGGTTIPGLTSRLGQTTVRLRDGQSFAIAGMLSDRIRSNIDTVPLLGDIPILGALFRSTHYRRDETELLIVVTIHMVRPMAPEELPPQLGEDETNDPDDFELFLLGRSSRIWGEEPQRGRREGPEVAGKAGFQR